MNKTTAMDLAKCRRQADSDVQEAGQIGRLAIILVENPIQGLAAWVLQYENRVALVTSERQRLGGPRRI